MIENIIGIDEELFLFLNKFHNPFFDQVMYLLTNQLAWIPFFLFVIYFIIRKFKINSIWILVGIGIVLALSDQVVSSFMKPYFERLRPSHAPDLEGLVHIVNGYKGGLYGFASSHAANSFGISFFLWLSTHKKIRWIWIMFVWAALFSYTRIYLGVHYPADILAGALVGIFLSLGVFLLYKFLVQKRKKLRF